MAMSLTHAQANLLAFIERYQAENNGVSPSFDEMQQELGLRGRGAVHRLLVKLEERGRIRREFGCARAIEIIPDTSVLASFPSTALIAELARRADERRAAA